MSIENTVGKGEIARYEQFLLFPLCFLFGELSSIFIKSEIVVCKLLQFGRVQILSFGKKLKGIVSIRPMLWQTIPGLRDPGKEDFESIMGKGENAGNEHFLLFLHWFLP